ncbi:MAG: outer membrane protein assembly factor BamE [Bacteriovoracaceae bacterium]|jgi:outer membrane protein assembly factor BamE (lipoprotein component of BamABCDE complex)|nr:outer membrane protein assembly factor BamE [Bacteriovoracaceae bacterium]
MKWILLLITIVSCSSNQLSIKEAAESKWSVLEQSIVSNWNKSKVLSLLGEPSQKSGKNEDSWVYYSDQTRLQEWVIGFDIKSKKVIKVTFGPTGFLNTEFTLDKILKRWKGSSCKKMKSKMYTKGHTVYQDTYYLCGPNKRIDVNRYNEVTWISVSKDNKIKRSNFK